VTTELSTPFPPKPIHPKLTPSKDAMSHHFDTRFMSNPAKRAPVSLRNRVF